jgi:transposase-like protein
MAQRKRRFFSPEFKAQAVDLVHQSGQGVKQIAQGLDVTETWWPRRTSRGRRT